MNKLKVSIILNIILCIAVIVLVRINICNSFSPKSYSSNRRYEALARLNLPGAEYNRIKSIEDRFHKSELKLKNDIKDKRIILLRLIQNGDPDMANVRGLQSEINGLLIRLDDIRLEELLWLSGNLKKDMFDDFIDYNGSSFFY